MRNSAIDREIRSRIEAFMDDVTGLLREAALEAVREALGETAPAARRGPGRPPRRGPGRPPRAKAAKRGRRGRRSSADVEQVAQRILAHVKAHPGDGAEQIGRALGMVTKDMRLPLLKLLGEKKLRTEGQRRGTKYFAGAGGARGAGRKAKRRGRKAKAA